MKKMKKMKKQLVALGALAFAAAACGASPRLAVTDSPIIGGQLDGGHPAVVAVLNNGPTPYGCSGTFIDPTTVVTAAHCAQDTNPADYEVVGGAVISQASFIAQVRLVAADPRWHAPGDAFDVGVLVIDPTAVQYAPSAKLPTPLRWQDTIADALVAPGASFTQVGFGQDAQTSGAFGTKREIALTVTTSSAYRFSYGSATADACFGDSGGPALAMVGTAETVVGVFSYITGPSSAPCTTGTDMRVDSDPAFVAQFIGLVSLPTPTPTASPTPAPAPAARGAGGCEVRL